MRRCNGTLLVLNGDLLHLLGFGEAVLTNKFSDSGSRADPAFVSCINPYRRKAAVVQRPPTRPPLLHTRLGPYLGGGALMLVVCALEASPVLRARSGGN
jgi:hypothetical protein